MNDKIKILMVDDEEQFRVTTKKILNRRGFETLQAGNGQQAIEMLKQKPDVVILDIKMPQMDGLEALKLIKEIAPKTPVIMLTGHGSLDSAQEALKQGAYDYLVKPSDIDLLSSKIIDAYNSLGKKEILPEKLVKDVMVPIDDYTSVDMDVSVAQAIKELKQSFTHMAYMGSIMEIGHRSILVTDQTHNVIGVLAIYDLLKAIMPGYLGAPRPFLADSIQYSPMFWQGLFTRETQKMHKRTVGEIMSPVPKSISYKANLAEAAYTLVVEQARRLVVKDKDKVVGVLREQDLFFEMSIILSD